MGLMSVLAQCGVTVSLSWCHSACSRHVLDHVEKYFYCQDVTLILDFTEGQAACSVLL